MAYPFFLILALLCAWTASFPVAAQVACPQANSGGNPVVQNQHVFCGEVSGNPLVAKGFHSRPGGHNPNSIGILPGTTALQVPMAPVGIYALRQFNITENGNTRLKALSTMFPDACTQANVVTAIQHAANGAAANGQFVGTSGNACQAGNPPAPFNIIGYMQNGQVRTAWPNY